MILGTDTPSKKTDWNEILWCYDKSDTDTTSVQAKQNSFLINECEASSITPSNMLKVWPR